MSMVPNCCSTNANSVRSYIARHILRFEEFTDFMFILEMFLESTLQVEEYSWILRTICQKFLNPLSKNKAMVNYSLHFDNLSYVVREISLFVRWDFFARCTVSYCIVVATYTYTQVTNTNNQQVLWDLNLIGSHTVKAYTCMWFDQTITFYIYTDFL